jgi:competence protein ComEC
MLPFAFVFHGLAGVFGLIFAPLGTAFGWLAWGASSYIMDVVQLVADFPVASFETGTIAPLLVVGYYGVAVGWYIAHRSGVFANLRSRQEARAPIRFRLPTTKWIAVPMTLAAILVWTAALSNNDRQLHVLLADVGQGDSALIVTPSGRQVLIDGGPDQLDATRSLGSKLPFWDSSLDMVILSHGHADHVTGLVEVLRRYEVKHIVERELDYGSPVYLEWKQAVSDEGAVTTQAETGQIIDLGDGVGIEVLAPPQTLLVGTDFDANNASVVLRVVYNDVSFLLTGDMFQVAERDILSQGIPVHSTVLKVAHHGSRTSSLPQFVERVGPSVAVLSVGQDNRFGNPHPETIDTLHQYVAEDRIFQTNERGTIEFITNGTTLRVKTER